MLCYSFLYTGISIAEQMKEMEHDSNTGSLLQRAINRLIKITESLPEYLIMENVSTLVGNKHLVHFMKRPSFLSELQYHNCYEAIIQRNAISLRTAGSLFWFRYLGMCLNCSRRRYRWQKNHRLTERQCGWEMLYYADDVQVFCWDIKNNGNGFMRRTVSAPMTES